MGTAVSPCALSGGRSSGRAVAPPREGLTSGGRAPGPENRLLLNKNSPRTTERTPQGQARRHDHRPGPGQQRGRTRTPGNADPVANQSGKGWGPGGGGRAQTQATAAITAATPRPSGCPSRHPRQEDAPRPGRDVRLPAGQRQGPTASRLLASGPGAACRPVRPQAPGGQPAFTIPGPGDPKTLGRVVLRPHSMGGDTEAGVSSPGQLGGAGLQERLAELRCSRGGHGQQTPTGVSPRAGHCPGHLVTGSSRPPLEIRIWNEAPLGGRAVGARGTAGSAWARGPLDLVPGGCFRNGSREARPGVDAGRVCRRPGAPGLEPRAAARWALPNAWPPAPGLLRSKRTGQLRRLPAARPGRSSPARPGQRREPRGADPLAGPAAQGVVVRLRRGHKDVPGWGSVMHRNRPTWTAIPRTRCPRPLAPGRARRVLARWQPRAP